MNGIKNFFLLIVVLILIVVYSSFFIVKEGQHAIVLRLGEMVKAPQTVPVDLTTTTDTKVAAKIVNTESKTATIKPATKAAEKAVAKTETKLMPIVYGPGLHFKLPFVESVDTFDTRLQTMDTETSRIMTKQLKEVMVDYYVKWKISDLPLFYKRTGGQYTVANTLLRQQLNDILRAQFGTKTIPDVVYDDRSEIMHALQLRATKTAASLGIYVADVRIKAIDLPETVSQSVYLNMSAERTKIAKGYRAQGQQVAQTIRANADAQATVIVANARGEADNIRGQGNALAAKIYADAYNKNPSFYSFYRSLEAYQDSFNSKKDIMVLQPDSQFFNFFNTAGGKK